MRIPSVNLARLGEKITGPPAIHQAAAECDLPRLRVLAQKQYNLDEVDQKYGRTAMHIAAEKCHALVVGELLDRRAASGLVDKEGRTPLLIAAQLGHLEVVQLLLGGRNRDPNRGAALGARDARGYTPLLAAAAGGHSQVLRLLIEAGAFLGDTLENRVSAGHLACKGGHLAALAVLVESGLNVRADTLDRVTLLHEAAHHGHVKVVEWLLAAGVDPNIRTLSNRATALELAILEGCHQAIQALRGVTTAPIAGPLAPPGAPAAPHLADAIAAGAAASAFAEPGGGHDLFAPLESAGSSGGGGGGGGAYTPSLAGYASPMYPPAYPQQPGPSYPQWGSGGP